MLVHATVTGKCPDYLQTIVQPATSLYSRLHLVACSVTTPKVLLIHIWPTSGVELER